MRDGRYVVPVRSEYKNEVAGLVHDTSATGQTFFIEPMSVVEANNEIRVLKSREQAEIERITQELSARSARMPTASRTTSALQRYWSCILQRQISVRKCAAPPQR